MEHNSEGPLAHQQSYRACATIWVVETNQRDPGGGGQNPEAKPGFQRPVALTNRDKYKPSDEIILLLDIYPDEIWRS